MAAERGQRVEGEGEKRRKRKRICISRPRKMRRKRSGTPFYLITFLNKREVT